MSAGKIASPLAGPVVDTHCHMDVAFDDEHELVDVTQSMAAARAVIFAQMVDDPSSWPDLFPTEKKQEKEKE